MTRFKTALAIVALAATGSAASAQIVIGGGTATPVGGISHHGGVIVVPHCNEYWVDPVNGNDFSNPGTLAQPFQTLSNAMYMVQQPAVINLLPGTYAPSTNGESWPLWCLDDVSVQGTNMLNTVLKGEGSDVLYLGAVSQREDFSDTLYDGFTITDADVAIRFIDEFWSVRPTFANMSVVKNNVGVEMFAIDLGPDASPDDTNNDGFIEFRPSFVNLTIADNNIGILDWNNASPPFGPAEPCIVNCVIYPNAVTDLEGIDQSDLLSTLFCTSLQAGISSLQGGKTPPIGSLTLCNTPADDIYMDRASCDYRQLPASILEGKGQSTNLVCHGQTVKIVFPCGQRVFDADGEGYCNPRIHGDNGIDVGADELGDMIIAGYIPGTTTFGTDSSGTVYDTARVYVPGPLAPPVSALMLVGIPMSTGYANWLPAAVPGSRPRGTTIPTSQGSRGDLCIRQTTLQPPFYLAIPSPTVPAIITLPLPASLVRHNVQELPTNPSGLGELSNLQSYLVGP